MKCRLLLNIVILESASIFKLLASKNKSLLVWWDAFLVLDFSFNILNGVALLNIKRNRFTSEGLNENLHFYLFL